MIYLMSSKGSLFFHDYQGTTKSTSQLFPLFDQKGLASLSDSRVHDILEGSFSRLHSTLSLTLTHLSYFYLIMYIMVKNPSSFFATTPVS